MYLKNGLENDSFKNISTSPKDMSLQRWERQSENTQNTPIS